jgi:hypothetical protein
VVVAAALACLAGVIVAERRHTYAEPLERDLTTYAVIGHELLAGRELYSDVWDHKPPAVHVSYASAEALAGYGRDAVFLLNVVFAVGTLLGVYAAGAAVGGRAGGLTAAGVWTILCGDLPLQANQPNTEVFLNTFLSWGFALLARTGPGWPFGYRRALAVGALFAAASLYKHVAVAPAALLAAAHVAYPPHGSGRRRALADAGLMAAAGAIAWAAVLGYFRLTGQLDAFLDAVFRYNRYYAGNPFTNLGSVLHPGDWFPLTARAAQPLAGLVCIGTVFGLLIGPDRSWLLLTAWALGTQLAVALPARPLPHYPQLWLPVLAVASGWVPGLIERVPRYPASWPAYLVLAAAPLVVLVDRPVAIRLLLFLAVVGGLTAAAGPARRREAWLAVGLTHVMGLVLLLHLFNFLDPVLVLCFGNAAAVEALIATQGPAALVLLAGATGAWAAGRLAGAPGAVTAALPYGAAGGLRLLYDQPVFWLPVLVLAAAWAARRGARLAGPVARELPYLAAGVAGLFLLSHELRYYRLSPEEWSRWKYGDVFIESAAVGRRVADLLVPGETFYEIGNETGIYFTSRCRPLSGIFYSYPVFDGPLAAPLSERVLKDLERAPPELLIIMKGEDSAERANHPVVRWFAGRYRPAPGESPSATFRFWVRREGTLESRLAARDRPPGRADPPPSRTSAASAPDAGPTPGGAAARR